MPAFTIATEAEAAALANEPTDSYDAAPYAAVVGQMAGKMVDANYSQWFKLTLAADEKQRTEKRRLFKAATAAGKHIAYGPVKKDQPNVLWMRLRPAPVKRASRNGKVKEGEKK